MTEINNNLFVLAKYKKKKIFESVFLEIAHEGENNDIEFLDWGEKYYFISKENKVNAHVTKKFRCTEECDVNFIMEKNNNARIIFTIENKLNGVQKFNSANIGKKNIYFNIGDIFSVIFIIEKCDIGDTLCIFTKFNCFGSEYEEKFVEFDAKNLIML